MTQTFKNNIDSVLSVTITPDAAMHGAECKASPASARFFHINSKPVKLDSTPPWALKGAAVGGGLEELRLSGALACSVRIVSHSLIFSDSGCLKAS
jgi:hypothetical protein